MISVNLWHAARNRETVTIGGGLFGPDELAEASRMIVAAVELRDALEWALDRVGYALNPDDIEALEEARATIARTAGVMTTATRTRLPPPPEMIDAALDRIVADVREGDLTAIEVLLSTASRADLRAYLPEVTP